MKTLKSSRNLAMEILLKYLKSLTRCCHRNTLLWKYAAYKKSKNLENKLIFCWKSTV